MTFEDELRKGNFQIPECTNCKKIVWPPSYFCNHCLVIFVGGNAQMKAKSLNSPNKMTIISV